MSDAIPSMFESDAAETPPGNEARDNSGLVAPGPLSVSPDGGATDEAFPKPGVEYDFCLTVNNIGKSQTEAFFVRFNLSGDQDPPLDLDFTVDDGLDAGGTVQAVVHFGTFPNKFGVYNLSGTVYLKADPGTPLRPSVTYDITINSQS
jgi:hypothetical protein